MDVAEPFRIFIGTDETQVVAHQVLAHSIRKHASIPVSITPLFDLPIRVPKDPANHPRTGFSFYKYKIPELCGFQGRALYIDPDMLVFGDVAELAALPFGDHGALCTTQPVPPKQWEGDPKFRPGRNSAVVLLDCSRLRWDVDELVAGLDEGRYSYPELRDLYVFGSEVGATIPTEWNHLERYEPNVTRLTHFTVVFTQPWKADNNPLGDLWTSAYREALHAGAVSPGDVAEGVLAGHIKSSLAAELATAPGGSSTLARALVELGEARANATELAHKVEAMERSSSWRLGRGIVRTFGAPRRFVDRRRPRR
jgi:hypothetical protein